MCSGPVMPAFARRAQDRVRHQTSSVSQQVVQLVDRVFRSDADYSAGRRLQARRDAPPAQIERDSQTATRRVIDTSLFVS